MAEYTPTKAETSIEKKRLISLVKTELKEHGLVDLTSFVNNESREGFKHHGFVRSLAYRIEELGIAEVIPQKEWTEFYVKRNIYSKRHPIRFAFILAAVGVIFSIISGVVNAFTSAQINATRNEKVIEKKLKPVEEGQKILFDSIVALEYQIKNIQDTLLIYRR